MPGNHDLWNIEHPDKSTGCIYDRLKEFDGNLCDRPFELNADWTVIGDTLWYDYSFADKRFSLEDLSSGRYSERNWKDKVYIDWGTGDIEMTDLFIRELKNQLEANRSKNVILVSHMLTHRHFTVKNNELWEYFNGYLGTEKLRELYTEYPNIKYSIMGHVHYRKSITENGTEYICNCLNYRNEWYNEKAEDELALAVKTIEI